MRSVLATCCPERRSLFSLQEHTKHASFREIGIVIESCDFEPLEYEFSIVFGFLAIHALALELRDDNRRYARNRLRRRLYRTEKYGLAEREIVGMEKPASTVRQQPIAKHVEQRRFHIARRIPGREADSEINL